LNCELDAEEAWAHLCRALHGSSEPELVETRETFMDSGALFQLARFVFIHVLPVYNYF